MMVVKHSTRRRKLHIKKENPVSGGNIKQFNQQHPSLSDGLADGKGLFWYRVGKRDSRS